MKSVRHVSGLLGGVAQSFLKEPWASGIHLKNIPAHLEAFRLAHEATFGSAAAPAPPDEPLNPLREYFENHHEGPGIWKWEHYFEIYHRHLARFIGASAHMAEVGIYSGGSLPMWRAYFGSRMRIHGIDIEEACRVYEDEGIDVSIGDQADRAFWADFRARVPELDILIDDGGHTAEQQRITFEEVFPHLRPGGVFICEDIHGRHNAFAGYFSGYANALNATLEDGKAVLPANNFQRWCHSIHQYPFAVVIEKRTAPLEQFTNTRRGTHWQPFFDEDRRDAR